MTSKVYHQPETNIVIMEYSGNVSIDDIYTAIDNGWSLGEAKECLRFLTVFTEATLLLTLEQVIEVTEYMKSLGVSKDIRSAILVPPDGSADFEVQLHEYTAGTKGWRIQFFYNIEEAMDWLID